MSSNSNMNNNKEITNASDLNNGKKVIEKKCYYSILEGATDDITALLSGRPLLDERRVWNKLKYDKLIEIDDLNKVEFLKQKVLKLFFITSLSILIMNKLLRLSTSFNSIKKSYRVLIKTALSGFILYNNFLLATTVNSINLHTYFTNKYTPRWRKYNEEGEPLIMNPYYFSHDSLNEDQKQTNKLLYDKVKYKKILTIKKNKVNDKQKEIIEKEIARLQKEYMELHKKN